MRLQFPDGQIVMLDRPFTRGDINYPAEWLRNMTVAEREAWGLVELPEPIPPETPAAPTVPRIVTPLQGRVALQHFNLLTTIEAAVASHPDPKVKIAWEYATEFNRDSPTVLALSAALGITEAQLDEIFTFASGVTV